MLLSLGIFLLALTSCKKDKPSGPQFGTVTDVEGNVYKTVKIGNQWWMAENLKTHKLKDGTPISYVIDNIIWSDPSIASPMMCYYENNDVENKDKYGALYNWYAVNTGNLAPEGWHVATLADWEKMRDFLISNGYNYDGTTAVNKIAKSLAAVTGWANDPTPGNVGNDQESNNKSGLNILPGGIRESDGTFSTGSSLQTVWTSVELNQTDGISIKLAYNNPGLTDGWSSKLKGRPVRCVKD